MYQNYLESGFCFIYILRTNYFEFEKIPFSVLSRGVAMLFWKYFTGAIGSVAMATDCHCLTHASKPFN